MSKAISALFDNRTDAVNAVRELNERGVSNKNISIVASDPAGEYAEYHGEIIPEDLPADDTIEGAATGALLGGVSGLLVGLAALAIPGIGPIVAAGPLAAAITGAGVGAATGGVLGALVDLGYDEDRAGYYAEGVRRGSTLVTAHVSESDAHWVSNVLDRHNPVDMDSRLETWRDDGWDGYDRDADPYTVDQIERERIRY